MKLKNAKTKPEIFYGLHMVEGVAEYREPGKDPYRIMIGESTLKNMDPTFAGLPVFVLHVDDVNFDNIQEEADGYVIESFFNKADGKHWVKFIAVSDEIKVKIKNGWKLSNAYFPKAFSNGGLWHGVEYSKEITGGEYEHLAVVPNPRYEESVILTPDEFKTYNEEKELELKKLANSKEKGEQPMKLSLFKKQKVENSTDFEGMSVTLPKSGKEKTLVQLVNEADEKELKKNDDMADMGHKVKLHDDSMCNVGELLEKHKALHDAHEALKAEHEELKAKHNEEEHEEDLHVEETPVDVEGDKHNEDDEEAKKKALELAEHEEKEIEAAKKKNAADLKKKNFQTLKNAPKTVNEEVARVELSEDQVARGKARYGSN